jgi:hypothetical protein
VKTPYVAVGQGTASSFLTFKIIYKHGRVKTPASEFLTFSATNIYDNNRTPSQQN